MNDLKDLYAQKGEIITNIEILQSELRKVQDQIVKLLNGPKKEEKNEFPIEAGEQA